VVGVDEAGRGCWFGPVVVASVLLTPDQARSLIDAGVNDSKRVSPKKRDRLAQLIRDTATAVYVAEKSSSEIDEQGILVATLAAMDQALAQSTPSYNPDLCLVDGNIPIPKTKIPQECVPQGDQKEIAIAAASIVAKVHRDRVVVELAKQYPGYGIEKHKGYGTAAHRTALENLGPTPHHRHSFKPVKSLQSRI
ncbi:MAG: ribonuclease HII, partial [Cyanobacteria bacterium P01_H01_bin.130]